MSKRFGRNQRRRAREEAARLREALQRETQLARYLTIQMRRNKETLERVADTFGRHFAALPPETVRLTHKLQKLELPWAGDVPLTVHEENVDNFVRHSMHLLKCHWPDLRGDHLRQLLHTYVETPAGEFGYAITEEAIHGIPPELVAQHISEALRHWLTERLHARA